MSYIQDRYILGSEVAVSTGPNLDLALALARADLGEFDSKEDPLDNQNKTVAGIAYLEATETKARFCELLTLIVTGLLKQLPKILKPLPLFLTMPEGINQADINEWKDAFAESHCFSLVKADHSSGCQNLETASRQLTEFDAVMAVAIDFPILEFETYAEAKRLYSANNPWGVILSEGAAGVVMTKRAVVDTLKLPALVRIESFHCDDQGDDGRACARLVRKNSRSIENFGRIYTDMTNQRHHTEDYGFAVGARSECIPDADQLVLINDIWGYLGNASALATLAVAIRETNSQLSTLFLFDKGARRAVLTLNSLA